MFTHKLCKKYKNMFNVITVLSIHLMSNMHLHWGLVVLRKIIKYLCVRLEQEDTLFPLVLTPSIQWGWPYWKCSQAINSQHDSTLVWAMTLRINHQVFNPHSWLCFILLVIVLSLRFYQHACWNDAFYSTTKYPQCALYIRQWQVPHIQ